MLCRLTLATEFFDCVPPILRSYVLATHLHPICAKSSAAALRPFPSSTLSIAPSFGSTAQLSINPRSLLFLFSLPHLVICHHASPQPVCHFILFRNAVYLIQPLGLASLLSSVATQLYLHDCVGDIRNLPLRNSYRISRRPLFAASVPYSRPLFRSDIVLNFIGYVLGIIACAF